MKPKILGSEARFSKKRYFATWIPDDPLNIDRYDEEVGEGIIEVLSSDDDIEEFGAPLNDIEEDNDPMGENAYVGLGPPRKAQELVPLKKIN